MKKGRAELQCFEIDGLLLASAASFIVESRTGLAGRDATKALRTRRFTKKNCRKLGLSDKDAEVLENSELILILARPALTDDLREAERDPKICVIAGSGGAFELVRDGAGLKIFDPADPEGGKVSGMGAAEKCSDITGAVRVCSDDGTQDQVCQHEISWDHLPGIF